MLEEITTRKNINNCNNCDYQTVCLLGLALGKLGVAALGKGGAYLHHSTTVNAVGQELRLDALRAVAR